MNNSNMKRKRRTARKKRPTVSSRKKFTRNKGRYNKLPKRSYRKKITRKKTRHKKKRKRTIRKKKIYYGGAGEIIRTVMKELRRGKGVFKKKYKGKKLVTLNEDGLVSIHKDETENTATAISGKLTIKPSINGGILFINFEKNPDHAPDMRKFEPTESSSMGDWERLEQNGSKWRVDNSSSEREIGVQADMGERGGEGAAKAAEKAEPQTSTSYEPSLNETFQDWVKTGAAELNRMKDSLRSREMHDVIDNIDTLYHTFLPVEEGGFNPDDTMTMLHDEVERLRRESGRELTAGELVGQKSVKAILADKFREITAGFGGTGQSQSSADSADADQPRYHVGESISIWSAEAEEWVPATIMEMGDMGLAKVAYTVYDKEGHFENYEWVDTNNKHEVRSMKEAAATDQRAEKETERLHLEEARDRRLAREEEENRDAEEIELLLSNVDEVVNEAKNEIDLNHATQPGPRDSYESHDGGMPALRIAIDSIEEAEAKIADAARRRGEDESFEDAHEWLQDTHEGLLQDCGMKAWGKTRRFWDGHPDGVIGEGKWWDKASPLEVELEERWQESSRSAAGVHEQMSREKREPAAAASSSHPDLWSQRVTHVDGRTGHVTGRTDDRGNTKVKWDADTGHMGAWEEVVPVSNLRTEQIVLAQEAADYA